MSFELRADALDDALDRLTRQALADEVAPGWVVGVIRPGERRVRAYGQTARGSNVRPDGDTLYEIGSVTKTFTGLLLAEAVRRGEVGFDDPLRKRVPEHIRVPVFEDRPIALWHLASHVSGLPRMPDNFMPADPLNPYADYDETRLHAFLSDHRLRRAPGTYEYSNYAMGLLGSILARRAGVTYAQLLQARVLKPLKMSDTRLTLDAASRPRLAPPHDAAMKPVKPWDFDALAGAGAIRSSVHDMMRYLDAQLSKDPGPLYQSVRGTHAPRHTMKNGMAVGLGWHIAADGISRVHAGMTGGYAAYAAAVPECGVALVVLANAASPKIAPMGEQMLRAAFGLKVEVPEAREAVRVPVETLRRYVGVYRLAPMFALTVSLEGERLMVQATGQQKLPVYAMSPTRFFYRVVQAEIVFEVGDTGEATGLVLHQNGRAMAGERQ